MVKDGAKSAGSGTKARKSAGREKVRKSAGRKGKKEEGAGVVRSLRGRVVEIAG